MSSEDSKSKEAHGIVGVVGKVIESVPVYQDLLQPAARELGKSLNTVAKAVNLALEPVGGLIWGWEQVRDFIVRRVSERLGSVPAESIVSPEPHIAVPVIAALRYTGEKPELRELFASLLATSMTRDITHYAHPGFVPIIGSLSPDEAKMIVEFRANSQDAYPVWRLISLVAELPDESEWALLDHFSDVVRAANCQHPNLVFCYVDNLIRLGMLKMSTDPFGAVGRYKKLEEDVIIQNYLKEKAAEHPTYKLTFRRGSLHLTNFGKQFLFACGPLQND